MFLHTASVVASGLLSSTVALNVNLRFNGASEEQKSEVGAYSMHNAHKSGYAGCIMRDDSVLKKFQMNIIIRDQ